jgi:hypothetical protein
MSRFISPHRGDAALASPSACRRSFSGGTSGYAKAKEAAEGFYARDKAPEIIFTINGQKEIRNIRPEPIQSIIINCLRVSGYFR